MNNGTVRVLLIEDDPDDYILTSGLLADIPGENIELDWAKDYESGLEAIRNCEHDAYLVDYGLGKRDGIELLREAIQAGCKGPMILLTGVDDRDLAFKALDVGATDFLIKGQISADNLERTIRFALRQARYADELEQRVRDRTAALAQANHSLKEIIAELSRVGERMRSSDERFRLALSTGAVTVYEQDTDLRYKWVYPQPAHRSNIIGMTDAELTPDTEDEARLKLKRRVLKTGKSARGEVSANIKGKKRWYDLHVEPRRNSGGKLIGLGGTALEITERKLAEDKLSHQKRLLEALVESVLDGILIVSPDGEMLHHNQQFLDIWNFPTEIVESKSDEAALKWASEQTTDPAAFLTRVTDIYNQPVARFREEMSMKDGRVYERFGAPVRDGDIRLGWVWTFRDITERKLAEKEIRHLADFNRDILNSITDGFFALDSDWRFTFANLKAESILKREAGDLIGKVIWDVYPGLAGSEFERAYHHTLNEGELSRFTSYYPDHDVWYEVKAYPAPNGITVYFGDVTDRVRADDTLRENENRLRTMANSIPQLAWMAEPDGSIFWYNLKWYEYTGTTAEEMDGWGWQSVHDPAVLPEVLDRWTRSIKTGEPFEMEFPLRGSDGVFRWFLTRVSPVREADGKITRWFGTNTDIDESRKVLGALRESEERFAKAFNSSPLSITITSLETGRLLEVNDAFIDATGYSRTEATGRTTRELGLWNDETDRDAELQIMISKGHLRDREYGFRMRDGREIVGLLSAEVIEVNGKPCALTVIQDVTARKLAAEEVRNSEQKLRAIFDSTREYIALLSPDGILLETNRSSLEFGHSKREDEVGRPFWDTVWFRFTDGAPEIIREFVMKAAGGEFVSLQILISTPTGEAKTFEFTFCPVKDKDGTVILIVPEGRDITEQKAAENVLRQQAALIELSSEAIFAWNSETGIIDWNKGAEELYGYTRGESIGQVSHRLLKTVHGGGLTDFEKTLKEQGAWFGEVRHFTKDGRELVIESRQQLVQIQGQRLTLETNRDVTARHLAEIALQNSEEKYRTLFDTIDEGFCTLEVLFDEAGKPVDYRFLECNPMFSQLTGLENAAGRTARELVPDLEDFWVITYGRVAMTGEAVRFESGSEAMGRWFDVYASRVGDQDSNKVVLVFTNITERKLAEQALRQSEERRHLAQTAGNVGVWDWNIAEGKTYWSDTMWKLYGEERRDINPGDSFWSSHLHVSDRERVKQNLDDVVSSRSNEFRDEYRVVRPDGSIRWVEAMGQVARDATGRAIRMYGVNLDTSERKDAEERIKLSENQLRLVTNSIPALISYVDSSERYRFVNQRFAEWFGIPTTEIVGRTVRDVFKLPAYNILKPEIDKALAGQQSMFETSLNFKSAGSRSIQIFYTPDVGVDGTVYGYYGLTNDLSEMKRAQELLKSSEDRMSLMFENVTDYAIFSMDSEGRIDSWNSGASIIFGYPREQIIGLTSEILYLPEDIARSAPLKEMRTARQKGRAANERWLLRMDGTPFYATNVTMPLYLGKVLIGYATIVSDLTEKQRRAEELQRAHDDLELRVKERTRELAESNLALVQEMDIREIAERKQIDLLGRLVTSQEFERRRIARDLHDQLGQKLTALRLKIASLKEISFGEKEIAARVDRLQEIGEQLDSEVSFLAWELRPTALDDLGLVDAVGAFVNEWSRHYEIAANFHSGGLAEGRLNHETETHLYRITQEALNNIVKHARAKLVTVLLEKRGDKVILIVEDDGVGFEPRIHALTSDTTRGLGLIGMRERAMLVGGDVEFESAPGKGTTIYVRVPISK